MKESTARTLLALGYQVRSRLKTPGMRCLVAQDVFGGSVLLVSSKPLGIPWSSIAEFFKELRIEYKILEVERPILVCVDSPPIRKILEDLNNEFRLACKTQIHISEVGFVETRRRKSIDLGQLALPALSVAATLAVGGVAVGISQPEEKEPITQISCALDLEARQFNAWLSDKSILLQSENNRSELIDHSDLGTLELKILQSIGTTRFVEATISCSNGDAKIFGFRTDSSEGEIYALSEVLDSKVG